VIFDQAETAAFFFERELRSRFPDLDIQTEVGDICHKNRVSDVMAGHQVDAVFHAAAYKHVPMMEHNVLEAVENNIFGTLTVARVALEQRCSHFLMISSDKAVNPTSVMGLTKRVAEIVLSALPFDGDPSPTKFISVRFGNVLGSSGSVVPIFQQQIEAGGPVTVTHPDMRRYFMTIPEAVQLVLQAYSMGDGSEIFVLDMGEPVRIVNLARNMIRLAGFEPEVDIAIRFTGLRPGEKLFEELCLEGEHVVPTPHSKIRIFSSPPPEGRVLSEWLNELRILHGTRRDGHAVLAHLAKLVPEYQPKSKRYEPEGAFPETRMAAVSSVT
jgi:FlaA1/EpsC-like NDP-sugar epimerase